MNKFVATLVHENDKTEVVALRDQIGLNEKDTMALLIKFGMQHEEEIRAIAAKQVEAEKAEREANRKAKYELLKVAMQEARAKAKMQKTIEKVKAAEAVEA